MNAQTGLALAQTDIQETLVMMVSKFLENSRWLRYLKILILPLFDSIYLIIPILPLFD